MKYCDYHKKFFLILLLFGIIMFVSCSQKQNYEIDDIKPPLPEILIDGAKIESMQGSYYWKGENNPEFIPDIDVVVKDMKPVTISNDTNVRINFSSSPEIIELDRIEGGLPIEMKPSTQGNFKIKNEPGIHTYSVLAKWGKDICVWGFRVEVK